MDQPLICRTCAEIQVSGFVYSLNRDLSDDGRPNYRNMLEKCVPGMMLHISKEPLICKSCADKLKISYDFIINCLHVERIIYSHIRNIDNLSPETVDLSRIFHKGHMIVNEVKKEDPESSSDSAEGSRDIAETLHLVEVKLEPENARTTELVRNRIQYMQDDSTDDSDVEIKIGEPLENKDMSNMNEDRKDDYSDDDCFIESEEDTAYNKPWGSKSRKFKCDKCTYKAYNQRLLDNHKKKNTCHLKTCHFCKICDFKTNRKGHLTRHMLTHGGQRPHVCQICGNGYTEKWSYKLHLLKHSGNEKPHKCAKCSASFFRKHDLKVHMERHDSGKYKCEDCDKVYKDKRGLEGHMSLHTGEHKYRCANCNFGASWKKSLIRHLKAKHVE